MTGSPTNRRPRSSESSIVSKSPGASANFLHILTYGSVTTCFLCKL